MAGGEDRAFDVLKRWRREGKGRSRFDTMAIRERISHPRKATRSDDYALAVREWEAEIDELRSYAPAEYWPSEPDLLAAYMSLLDPDSKKFAMEIKACGGEQGPYAGDHPEEVRRKLQAQVES